MNPMTYPRAIALAGLSLLAGTASAHTGDHVASGLASGLAHPFMGLDHLLAMVAVGLWAAQQGGRALWALPGAFLGAMLLGLGLAGAGWMLPHVETAVALSVLVLGLLIALRHHARLRSGMFVTAAFALFHGYAHGLDMPHAASPMLFATGFVLATGCLHALGIAGSQIGRLAVRMSGLGIAITGMVLVLGA